MSLPFDAPRRSPVTGLRRLPAVYTPDRGLPICPRCWSQLDLNWGKGRGLGDREVRGWGVSRGELVAVDGTTHPVTMAVHRCANHDCPTAVEIAAMLSGGYVPALVEGRRLAGAEGATFAAGRHDEAGVWRGGCGEARTAPAQRDLFGG